MAGSRLRQIERSGSLGHVPALGDGAENAELLQRHVSSPYRSQNEMISRHNIYWNDCLRARILLRISRNRTDKAAALNTSIQKIPFRRFDHDARGQHKPATVWPGLVLTAALAGTGFALREIPGLRLFSPMILDHDRYHLPQCHRHAVRAKTGVVFSLRRILRLAIVLLGLQLTAQEVVDVGGKGSPSLH